MSNLNLSKKMIPAPLPPFEHQDAGLSRDELLKIVRHVENPSEPFGLDTDIDPEIAERVKALGNYSDVHESVAAIERAIAREHEFERQEQEKDGEWLNSPTSSEPATSGEATAAAYGDLDLGTHVVISGGEVLELGTITGDSEIPF